MIRDVRAHLTAALAAAGIPVHTYPGGTLIPPGAVLLPADPYWAPTQLGGAEVGLTVRLTVPSAPGSGAAASLDDMIETAVQALIAAGVRLAPVAAPEPQTDAGALTADLTTYTPWED